MEENQLNGPEGRKNIRMADAKKVTMDELLANAGDSIKKAATGDVVSGTVLSVKARNLD